MGMFSGLNTEGLEEKTDNLGGGFAARETDVYEADILIAYGGESPGGAKFVDFTFMLSDGKEYSETFYVTSGRDKGQKNYFMAKDKDKKETGKKRMLPGFEQTNDICLMVTEKELEHQQTEEKPVLIWDKDSGKKIPKNVPVLVELIGGKVFLAIQKIEENKTEKDGSGAYVEVAGSRFKNEVTKVAHHPSRLTVLEAMKEQEASFLDAWEEKNKGQTYDKRKIKDGEAGQSGRPGGNRGGPPTSSAPGASGGGERKSLFNKG